MKYRWFKHEHAARVWSRKQQAPASWNRDGRKQTVLGDLTAYWLEYNYETMLPEPACWWDMRLPATHIWATDDDDARTQFELHNALLGGMNEPPPGTITKITLPDGTYSAINIK